MELGLDVMDVPVSENGRSDATVHPGTLAERVVLVALGDISPQCSMGVLRSNGTDASLSAPSRHSGSQQVMCLTYVRFGQLT